MGEVMLDTDDLPKRSDVSDPRPHASHPGMTDVHVVSELLKPYDARLMRSYPVTTRINHVANDDVECSKLVQIVEVQDRLFS
jgi:hypothetical protein